MNVLDQITRHYATSGDFNGFPLRDLATESSQDLLTEVRSLVSDGKICLLFEGKVENPAIMRWPPAPSEEQLSLLDVLGADAAWAYPTSMHLHAVTNRAEQDGSPFTLCLALGEPQLSFKAFDPAVLERYRNDPRFEVTCNDINGSISVADGYVASLPEEDQAWLESFGFGYGPDGTRVVVAFTRYLSKMSPKQQSIWSTYLLDGEYKLHPDYRNIALGVWDLGKSIFTAFLAEQREVNHLCELIGRPTLFNRVRQDAPRGFGWIIRPTIREFTEFIQLLDKLMSDNLNQKFFKGEVPAFRLESRADGSIERIRKGTIAMLEEWLNRVFHRMPEKDPINAIIQTFREIRSPRSRGSHTIIQDSYDAELFEEQRVVMVRAYRAVQGLRLALQSHPLLADYQPPAELETGPIWLA